MALNKLMEIRNRRLAERQATSIPKKPFIQDFRKNKQLYFLLVPFCIILAVLLPTAYSFLLYKRKAKNSTNSGNKENI